MLDFESQQPGELRQALIDAGVLRPGGSLPRRVPLPGRPVLRTDDAGRVAAERMRASRVRGWLAISNREIAMLEEQRRRARR